MNTMAMATESKSENNQLPPPHPIPNPAAASKMNGTGNGILIIGATGFIGRFVAEASLAAGYATYLLARPGSSNPSKDMALRSLQESGATVIHGCMKDKPCLEKLLSEYKIEVVISAVGGPAILDQLSLVEAIKAVPSVKRFLPSEFGHDIDRAEPVEPGLTMYLEKRKVRRAIEAAGIPYTYICCNSIAAWPYHDNTHPAEVLPPLDQFKIYGDGTVKAYFVAGEDIGKFTIKAVNDVRTLNKNLHFQPPGNCINLNEMASLWEKKIKRKLPRFFIAEETLLAAAAEMCIPRSIVAALTHDIFIKGCQINFSIDRPDDEEIGKLYPGIRYRTIDECFDKYLVDIIGQLDAGASEAIATPTALQNMLPETGVILGLS